MKRKSIGEGASPLVCTPLVGATEGALLAELAAVIPRAPDAIEWRADFFSALADVAAVLAMAHKIEIAAPECALIFTIRSRREGGQQTAVSDRQAMEIDGAICRESSFGYVDCELSAEAEGILRLRDLAHANDTKVIASYHNFELTPDRDFLVAKFLEAERLGLDVAKVAVMPQNMDDVLVLLGATLEGKRRVSLPLITMSMGGYGAISRMIGGAFGSALSFAVGQNASAPGQIPIADLRAVLGIIERSKGLK